MNNPTHTFQSFFFRNPFILFLLSICYIFIVFAGEEMDFLELLKSFGLDMGSVASALGIDMAALNNMDQEVLLHLLTSHTQQTN